MNGREERCIGTLGGELRYVASDIWPTLPAIFEDSYIHQVYLVVRSPSGLIVRNIPGTPFGNGMVCNKHRGDCPELTLAKSIVRIMRLPESNILIHEHNTFETSLFGYAITCKVFVALMYIEDYDCPDRYISADEKYLKSIVPYPFLIDIIDAGTKN
jgi:hypothetical protein